MGFKNYYGEPIDVPTHKHGTEDTLKDGLIAKATYTDDGFMSKEDRVVLSSLKLKLDYLNGLMQRAVYYVQPKQVTLVNGSTFNQIIKSLNPNPTKIVFTTDPIPENEINSAKLVSDDNDICNAYAYLKDNIIYISPEKEADIMANSSCSNMFLNLSQLTSIEFNNFNTSNVNSMDLMFYGCKSLTDINLLYFDTSNVTTFSGMFHSCNSLIELDLSNFNTLNIEDMSYLFYLCTSLKKLRIYNFDTSKVTNMKYMFYGCSNLPNIDLSNFDTSKVTNMSYMFYGCNNLTSSMTIMNPGTSVYKTMFSNCSNIEPAEFIVYYTEDTLQLAIKMVNTKTENCNVKLYTPDIILLPGTDFTTTVNSLSTSYTSIIFTDNAIPENKISSAKIVSESNSEGKAYAYLSGTTMYIAPEVPNSKIYSNSDSSSMFSRTKAKTITFDNFNTSNSTTMSRMFSGFGGTSLDLTNFNMSKVTDISWMFTMALSLKTIDITGWDTSKVTDITSTFSNCWGLTEIVGLKDLNTSSIKTMKNAFSGLTTITTLDLSGWDTSNTTIMNSMFSGCKKLTTIKGLEMFNTTKLQDSASMFELCHVLNGTMTIMNSSITKYSSMFSYASDTATTGFTLNYKSGCQTVAQNMVKTATGSTKVKLGTQV